MSGGRAVLEEIRQSWKTVLIVAVVSSLLGATSGLGYLQLRFVGVTGTPSDTVQRFLTALSQNDSVRALKEVARAPEDSSFLTDDVVRASHLDNPMSNIEVTPTRNPQVPVTFTLGGSRVETSVSVAVVDGIFKIENGFVTADLASVRALQTPVTLGDREVSTDRVTVFPGIYPLRSGDARLTFTPETSVRATEVGETVKPEAQRLALSEAGRTTIETNVQQQLDSCAKQAVAKPVGCPFSVEDLPKYATGTIRWERLTAPEITTSMAEGSTAKVTVSGRMWFIWTPPSGAAETQSPTFSHVGSVDLLASSWQVKWR